MHDARNVDLYSLTVTAPPRLPPIRRAAPALRPAPPVRRWRRRLEAAGVYLLRLLAVAAGVSATLYGYQVLLGAGDCSFHFSARYVGYGAAFLTAATLLRRWPAALMAAVALPCLHHLYETCAPLVPYVCALIPTLYWLLGSAPQPGRRESRRFWIGLIVGAVLVPKVIQNGFGFDHGSVLDMNQNLFAGLFLRYAYYFYERRRGFVPAGGLAEHFSYLLFVPQVTGMLNFPPSEMAARWGFGAETLRRGFAGLGWAAVKIPAVLYLQTAVLPAWGYARGYETLRAAPLGALWVCLLLSYLHWFLLISAKFDLMVALFRFFGVNVDDNFRWPLLATSPVDLWRRWNLYNRKLLLKFVYFPLGGNQRRVYRNIFLTFLASALLLHTGFLGSPWEWVDPAQLRDWLLYFAAQGALVCAAYWWLQRPFWERLPAGWSRTLRGLGWAFTLVSSAWLHILPLAAGNLLNAASAPIPGFTERLALMLRALGLPFGGS